MKSGIRKEKTPLVYPPSFSESNDWDFKNNPAIFEDFRGFSEDFARLPKMTEDVPTTC